MNLSELKRLAQAATPGPWKCYPPSEFPKDIRLSQTRTSPEGFNCGYIARLTRSHDPELSQSGTEHPRLEDAEFIAAANPQTVLELIGALEEAREIIEWMREDADPSRDLEATKWLERFGGGDESDGVMYLLRQAMGLWSKTELEEAWISASNPLCDNLNV